MNQLPVEYFIADSFSFLVGCIHLNERNHKKASTGDSIHFFHERSVCLQNIMKLGGKNECQVETQRQSERNFVKSVNDRV